ncbi:MAG: MBL fold metallo-hydrolase [Natronospirillum sp.]
MLSKINILGAGHSESLTRFNSNALLDFEGHSMLIDCGYTIKYALHKQGIQMQDIDSCLVTHVHGDHVFGLERFAFEGRYKYGKKLKLFVTPGVLEVLWQHTLVGSIGYSSEGLSDINDYFDVEVIDPTTPLIINGSEISLFPTPHTVGKESYGLVVDDSLVYTSDTNCLDREFLKEFDLIIHDATTQKGNPAHATLWELLTEYPPALRQKIILDHIDDDYPDFRELIDGEFLGVTQDGDHISVQPTHFSWSGVDVPRRK